METTELIERNFGEIKRQLSANLRLVALLIEEPEDQHLQREWQEDICKYMTRARHEIEAINEWIARRNVDVSRLSLIKPV
jgi:DNA-binding transcriptional regulator GbsR (MarR family)